ncbi:two-component system phosphate regulon sensor histidine kinase PhoR [Mucilaginibacter gracilis]|uniref:histidine kinase n=1 Tax=Mucilaginibacter gracilis TaxID=423350 RepID=A0A495IXY8_9SPHI|nr:HAMP domain-containing sensor histidine kinase [Mucilaginibacter gracilis]RKR81442.1 two-component system phosphate regulon sensor histidine kinase PhoR [Mucilaginibacter gracilis]
MTIKENIYRKNFSLIIAFVVLISAILVAALLIAYGLTRKYVENEFSSDKIDVLEKTTSPYYDFFQNKIPEITAYQGFLNETSASKYADSVFNNYPFVKSIDFYHFNISNRSKNATLNRGNLSITVHNVYNFVPVNSFNVKNVKVSRDKNVEDFKAMALKLSGFIEIADTTRAPTADELFKFFYDIKPNKISYINNPRREEIKRYKDLLTSISPSSVYQQDMMTFYLSPFSMAIKNTHPELYEHISIRPVVYDPLDNGDTEAFTEIALPGAFSDYKLVFQSNKTFIVKETVRRFLPVTGLVLAVYLFIVVIGWLIYRNLNVNHKMFKLQYDFINNFTHEFKTPVSVIKIAGSNLRSDNQLTDRQRMHYGKILDEEADKLNDLMNKLLSFTQLENKSIHLKKETIELEEFVQKYIDTFKIKYPLFKLTYEVINVKRFESDPVLLGSIFQNMIDNAYKYSPPERKEMHIVVERYRKELILRFKDKGIGIPKNEMKNIFKKFYRIESLYNQNGSVGLGLAFCKELVNFMNGEITVTSKVNEGSEFTVILPY